MTGFFIRRLGQSIIVIIGVTIIAFFLLHLIPGGPARALLGPRATAVQIKQFNIANGYNKPFWVQYFDYIVQLLHGNLGRSFKLNQSVTSILSNEMPKTILLVGTSTLLSIVIAIPIGVIQAVKRNKVVDYVGTGASFFLYAMPTFWAGQLLILLLAEKVHLFPAEAPQGSTITQVLSQPNALVLPILTLTLITYAAYSRYMRSSAIEALAQDWIRTAKAKGLSSRVILFKHMLRNALIPIATLVGLSIPGIFTNGLVAEQVFNYPGTGLDFYNAAVQQDYPLLLGTILVIALFTILGNLFADLAYAVLDPRVRYR
ncbi:MAG: ABC transporter permease [Acidimicrobiales bacterium]